MSQDTRIGEAIRLAQLAKREGRTDNNARHFLFVAQLKAARIMEEEPESFFGGHVPNRKYEEAAEVTQHLGDMLAAYRETPEFRESLLDDEEREAAARMRR
jgi:hypothetical protein